MGLDHTLTISSDTQEPKVYVLRKIYELHNYFERVYNIDNGELIEIDIGDIQNLNKSAIKILESKDQKPCQTSQLVTHDLPFRFKDDDNYYYNDMETILEVTTDILNQYVENEHILTYWCWY